MKVFEIVSPGSLDSVVPGFRDEPQPGPGQVKIQVRAAALNYRDLLVAKGAYSRNLPLPLIPLSDAAGEVTEVGTGVTRIRVGDRVAGCFMQRWLAGDLTEAAAKSALGGAIGGVLAEYVVLDAEGVVALPDHLSWEQAATLPCAALTAWHALVVEGGIQPGHTVLTIGSGGVSVFALQLAVASGCRVIALSGSDAKLERLKALGADGLINYNATPDWDRAVREWSGGAGVDHVVEVGGAGTLPKSLRAVRMNGSVSLIGTVAGGGEINPIPILMKNIRLQGIFVGSRAMFEEMNSFVSERRLQPVVDWVFPFDAAQEAYRYLESGDHFGKVVISMNE